MKTAVFVGHARAPSNSVTGQISKVIQVVMEIDKVYWDHRVRRRERRFARVPPVSRQHDGRSEPHG